MSWKEYLKFVTSGNEFLSIGISENGKEKPFIGVPWEMTATAMNMKPPQVFLTKEDIANPEFLTSINQMKCIGCYILDEISDYSFLYQPAFCHIIDLHIRKGYRLNSLDFLSKMPSLRLLYLEQVKVDKLSTLFHMENKGTNRMLDLYLKNCRVKKLDESEIQNGIISELDVMNDAYSKEEHERWQTVSSICFRYITRDPFSEEIKIYF